MMYILFADTLPSILSIVKTWQRIELDCWPSFLDDVRKQHEKSAEKVLKSIMLYF